MRPLRKREKTAVAVGAYAVAALLVFQVIWFPLRARHERAARALAIEQESHTRLIALRGQYLKASSREDKVKKAVSARPAGFTLFSFLDDKAQRAGVKDNIAYMKPSTVDSDHDAFRLSRVEMRLGQVPLEQLVAFLYQAEKTEDGIRIPRAAIHRSKKTGGRLDAVLLVECLIK